MARFRKKPVEIKAVPVADVLKVAADRRWTDLPAWLAVAYEAGVLEIGDDAVQIHTLEGEHRGDHSDWIVQGVQGELYPVKPDIFEATYDAVT